MKKKVTFLLVLLFISTHLYSNTSSPVISFSEQIKASKGSNILTSGKIAEKIYAIKLDNKSYSMLIYDTNLKFKKEVLFKKKDCKEGNCIDGALSYVETLFFKDRILILFEIFEKTTKSRVLLCQTFDLEGNFMGNLSLIDEIPASKKSNSGSFIIVQNKDMTQFVVIKTLPYDKAADQKFGFKTYDKDLKNLSNLNIELPYKDKNTEVLNYYLSNKGNIYLLISVQLEKKQTQKGEDKEFFSILSLDASSDNSLSEHKIQLPQKDIRSIYLQIDDNNEQVSCVGLYSDLQSSAKNSSVNGLFFLNIDAKTKQILSESYKPFEKDIIRQVVGGKENKKIKDSQGLHSTFHVQDFVKLSDGASYIIAENSWISSTTTCGKNGCITTHQCQNYNILAISISPQGEILSLVDIPKKQISVGRFNVFFSYLLMQKEDKIFLLYNDNPKNMSASATSIRNTEIFKKTKKGALLMAELMEDGKYSKTLLFSNKNKKIYAKPRFGFQVGVGIYVIPINAAKGNSFGFMRVEL